MTNPGVDLLDPAFRQDPYSTFRTLRQHGEVHRDRRLGAYVVAGRHAAATVLNDPDTYSSSLRQPPASTMYGAPTMIFTDPPDHALLRRGFAPFLSPASVREALAAIDGPLSILREPPTGKFDAMEAVCRPLPVLAICHILGIDPEAWRPLEEASNRLVQISGGPQGAQLRRRAAADLQRAFAAYVEEHCSRQVHSQASQEVVALVDRIGAPSVAAGVMLLLIAGHETTAGLLGNMIHMLTTQPELRDLAQRTPGQLLDEVLRLVGPVLALRRVATRDSELGSVPIPEGSSIVVLPAAANRDPAVYANPDKVSLNRANEPPPIAFGLGIHHCLGARLARLESEAVLEAWSASPARLELADPNLEYVPSAFVRRPVRLLLQAGY